jgi:hypothetical protein
VFILSCLGCSHRESSPCVAATGRAQKFPLHTELGFPLKGLHISIVVVKRIPLFSWEKTSWEKTIHILSRTIREHTFKTIHILVGENLVGENLKNYT